MTFRAPQSVTVHPRIRSIANARTLSVLFFLAGAAGVYFSTVVKNPYTILYPSAILSGTAVFLALHDGDYDEYRFDSTTAPKSILVLYFLVVSALFASYYTAGFTRTDGVFYLTFALYLLSAIYVFLDPSVTRGLPLVLLTGFINRITAYYASATYLGIDIFGHEQLIRSVVANGSLEGFASNKYFYAPVYHVLTAIGELLFDIPTRHSIALVTIVIVTVVPVLVVYSLTTLFWSRRVGLISSLVYVSADHVVYWGIHTIPTSIGLAFFGLIFLFLLRYLLSRSLRFYLLSTLFLFAIMFTHQVSLFISVTATLSLLAFLLIYQLRFSRTTMNIGVLCVLMVFVDFTTTKYAGPASENSFFDVVLSQFAYALLSPGAETRTGTLLPADPTISSGGAEALTLVQVGGSSLLVCFGIVGALYWIRSRDHPSTAFSGLGVGVVVAVLFAFTLGGPILGMRNLLPNRWFAYNYLLLAVLAGPGIVWLITTSTKRLGNAPYATIAFVVLLVGPYVVLMGGSAMASPDGPFFDDAFGAERTGTTERERQTIEHAVAYNSENSIILSDFYTSRIVSRSYSDSARVISMEHGQPETIIDDDQDHLLIYREYMNTKHARYDLQIEGETYNVYGRIPIDALAEENRANVYENGDGSIKLYE